MPLLDSLINRAADAAKAAAATQEANRKRQAITSQMQAPEQAISRACMQIGHSAYSLWAAGHPVSATVAQTGPPIQTWMRELQWYEWQLAEVDRLLAAAVTTA